MNRQPPRSPLFPYTTLFRSGTTGRRGADCRASVPSSGEDRGPPMPAPDFRSPYRHGFVRVAAATLRTVIGDPAANAASVLATARECHDEGVGLVVFPELTLCGYSLEDVLLQDTLLDAAEAALAEVVAGSAELLPVLVVGLPVRVRHRVLNVAA